VETQTLLTIGGFIPIPYILYAILQTLRKHPRVNGLGVLLAYAAVLIPIGIFAWGSARQSLPPLLELAAVSSAAITLIFGLLLFVRDLRSKPRAVSRSYGLLSLGVSVLMAAGLIAVPMILELIPNATASASAATNQPAFTAGQGFPGAAAAGASSLAAPAGFNAPVGFSAPAGFVTQPEATEESTSEPTRVATRENLRQAVLPTITPTLAFTSTPLATLTPLATATPVMPACQLMVLYNLNMRASASAESDLLLTIPYSSLISAAEYSGGWWLVSFENQTGWVNGEYVSALSDCSALTGS